MRTMFASAIGFALTIGWFAPAARSAPSEPIQSAIDRGRDFLLAAAPSVYSRGEKALVAQALSKAGVPADEPRLAKMVDEIAASVGSGEYKAEVRDGASNYEAAVMIMALSSVDGKRYLRPIEILSRFLISKQRDCGVWDYEINGGGDTSQTQYAVLGLFEASALGVEIPPEVWDKALDWHIHHQDVQGGFSYHPIRNSGSGRIQQPEVQHSTTVGGISSMIVCRSKLPFRGPAPTEEEQLQPGEFALLAPVTPDVEGEKPVKREAYTFRAKRADADEAIRLGMSWMNKNFTVDKPIGPPYYYLYGVERLAALSNVKTIGSADWYARGADHLTKIQAPTGQWQANYPAQVDTSFGVLFLVQSTKKTLQRIQITRLGEGSMVGGRGLPVSGDAPNEMAQRQPARFRAALRTPVDDILKSLTDPDAGEFDEGAAAAIETAKPEEIIQKLGANRAGLLKLAKHPNPIVREAGLWGMARLRDFRFMPILIDHLSDPDPAVYRASRDGLRFMSRRLETPLLPEAPPEKSVLDAAIADWRQWFETLRVEVDPQQEFDDGT